MPSSSTTIRYSNLELREPDHYNISSDVNSILSTEFISRLLTTGSMGGWRMITNTGKAAFAGGLATWLLRPPVLDNGKVLPYIGLDFDIFIPDTDFSNLARCENDLKIVLTAPPNSSTQIFNTYNFSTQFNMSEGGMLQIDNANRTWADTGITGPLVPNEPTHVSLRHFMDTANGRFSVQSMNGQPVPTPMQNLPLQPSNWTPVCAVQLQTELFAPGAVNTLYRNVTVTYSDSPF